MKNQWERFKHRTLTKVFLGYAVVAWVLIQVVEGCASDFRDTSMGGSNDNLLTYSGVPCSNIGRMGFRKIALIIG